MRALQHVAYKICTGGQEKSVYTKLGSLLVNHKEEEVIQFFKALPGETTLQSLPEEISAALPQAASSLDTTTAKFWVQWWTNQSMIIMWWPNQSMIIMWHHNLIYS